MARTKISVNAAELGNAIAQLEGSQKFSNRSALFDALAETSYAKNHNPPLSRSVLISRAKEFGIPMQTPPGKPGRPKGSVSKKRTEAPTAGATSGIEDGGNEHDLDNA